MLFACDARKLDSRFAHLESAFDIGRGGVLVQDSLEDASRALAGCMCRETLERATGLVENSVTDRHKYEP
jgi:hypothetical protein